MYLTVHDLSEVDWLNLKRNNDHPNLKIDQSLQFVTYERLFQSLHT